MSVVILKLSSKQ